MTFINNYVIFKAVDHNLKGKKMRTYLSIFVFVASLFTFGCQAHLMIDVKDVLGKSIEKVIKGEINESCDATLVLFNRTGEYLYTFLDGQKFVIQPLGEIELSYSVWYKDSRSSLRRIPVAVTTAIPSLYSDDIPNVGGAKKYWDIYTYNPSRSNDVWYIEFKKIGNTVKLDINQGQH